MSDSTQQYIQYTLNRSFNATRHDDGDGAYWLVDIPMDDQGGIWDKDFKEWAVPVGSVDNLQQQIEASINFACREYHEDYAINHGDARKRSEIVSDWAERIVSLIQGDRQ